MKPELQQIIQYAISTLTSRVVPDLLFPNAACAKFLWQIRPEPELSL